MTAVLFLTAPFFSLAASQDIIINEIAWMGTVNSANDEWIELKNTTSQNIDLSGWILKSSNEKLKITFKGTILANSFYLLERTNDSSVENIKADLIYKGSLTNSGMDLELYNGAGILVDNANYSSGWPAGDNTTKQTMERIGNNWQTSKNPGGTPKAENSSGAIKIVKKENQTTKSKENVLTETKKTDNKKGVAPAVITISKDNTNNTSFIVFSVSGLLVLLSAGIILFIKFKK